MADVAFGTSAFGVDAERLKSLTAEAINPPLCRITELLVFSEPYNTPGRATVAIASRADVAAYADDPDVIAAIGAAKWNFMTHAEALIHGDLHTGSVMVRDDSIPGGASTKAFDSEFAFYGPVGFDLGLLWANLLLAAARSATLDRSEDVAWRLANRWRRGTRSRRRCAGTGPHASIPQCSPTASWTPTSNACGPTLSTRPQRRRRAG